MIAWSAVIHHISPLAASILIASVWQGLLLTAGAALALRLARGIPPQIRMWIWTAVLVLMMGLPALALLPARGLPPSHVEMHVAEGWSVGLLVAWLVCVVWRGAVLATGALKLRRLARRALPITVDGSVAELLKGCGRQALLCVSPEVNRPSVTGLLQPRILLPEGLLEVLTAAELKHVVLHEMEHLRRGDDWLNLLQQLSLVALPLNPALLWLDRRLCRERELACDDGVLRTTRAHNAYAACLVKLAEDSLLRKGAILAMSALGTGAQESELGARVRRILSGPASRKSPRRTAWAAVAFLACTAALLARCPQWVAFEAQAQPLEQMAAVTTHWPVRPATLLPVAARDNRLGMARPVLAEAVLRGPGVAAAREVTLQRSRPRVKRPALRTVLAQGKVRKQMMLREEVTWSEAERAPGATPGGRFLMTGISVSQPVYAAVPWRGGWLIVQL